VPSVRLGRQLQGMMEEEGFTKLKYRPHFGFPPIGRRAKVHRMKTTGRYLPAGISFGRKKTPGLACGGHHTLMGGSASPTRLVGGPRQKDNCGSGEPVFHSTRVPLRTVLDS
jgi:hypothetical protein